MERRLAAVLIADVVGYGRLSQIDEEGTRARFRADLRDVFEPAFATHRGRLIKTMGDGLLVEFNSVVDALRCAVEVQRQKAESNAAEPADKRLDYRIGINLGDVIVEDDDIEGDGVNIAARLQTLAPPGGIVISGTAYDHVKSKLQVGFASLGMQKLKSIAEPVRAYRVVLDFVPTSSTAQVAKPRDLRRIGAAAALLVLLAVGLTAAWWKPWIPADRHAGQAASAAVAESRPSVVVLPFGVMSDDKEQTYLANGFTEDLTTELARIPGLFVVSRNAAFAYKGKATKPSEIAEALRVRYLLEGSIRRVGNDMRINAQLIEGSTEGHLWAERFDGDWTDVFSLQDRVVGRIAETLKVRLVSGQGKSDIAGGTRNPAAYDAYLRAQEVQLGNRPDDIRAAAELYRQAFAIDPAFGAAKASLAYLYWDLDGERAAAMGLSWDEINSETHRLLREASEHPSPTYYQMTADLLVKERRSDAAIEVLRKAVALDPSDPWTYEAMAYALNFNGKPEEARSYLDATMRVDPGWNDWRRYYAGLSLFNEGRFSEATTYLERIDLRSTEPWAKLFGLQVLVSCYGHLANAEKIESTMADLRQMVTARDLGAPTLLLTQKFMVFKNEADAVRLLQGLSKAGVPDIDPILAAGLGERVRGSELRSIIVGRELAGRWTDGESVGDYHSVSAADGTVTRKQGNQTDKGTRWVQGDFMCVAYPKTLTTCGAIFRNPTGTLAGRNEFIGIFRGDRIDFSALE